MDQMSAAGPLTVWQMPGMMLGMNDLSTSGAAVLDETSLGMMNSSRSAGAQHVKASIGHEHQTLQHHTGVWSQFCMFCD